jgi:hypothetical protein
MSEVIQDAQQEFWRPPVAAVEAAQLPAVPRDLPAMAETCPRCGTEFLLGSHFCHSCGNHRPEKPGTTWKTGSAVGTVLLSEPAAWLRAASARFDGLAGSKIKLPGWLRYLHFHEIKRWVGLPTASLLAFVIGLGCVAGALVVGLITAKTFVDWQAIQYYRLEWLAAATAAFVAGILLKKSSRRDIE